MSGGREQEKEDGGQETEGRRDEETERTNAEMQGCRDMSGRRARMGLIGSVWGQVG